MSGREGDVSWCSMRLDLSTTRTFRPLRASHACPVAGAQARGVPYRYGTRGGSRGVRRASWARVPSTAKPLIMTCLPTEAGRWVTTVFGIGIRQACHYQRFCRASLPHSVRHESASSPHRPILPLSLRAKGAAEYAARPLRSPASTSRRSSTPPRQPSGPRHGKYAARKCDSIGWEREARPTPKGRPRQQKQNKKPNNESSQYKIGHQSLVTGSSTLSCGNRSQPMYSVS